MIISSVFNQGKPESDFPLWNYSCKSKVILIIPFFIHESDLILAGVNLICNPILLLTCVPIRANFLRKCFNIKILVYYTWNYFLFFLRLNRNLLFFFVDNLFRKVFFIWDFKFLRLYFLLFFLNLFHISKIFAFINHKYEETSNEGNHYKSDNLEIWKF